MVRSQTVIVTLIPAKRNICLRVIVSQDSVACIICTTRRFKIISDVSDADSGDPISITTGRWFTESLLIPFIIFCIDLNFQGIKIITQPGFIPGQTVYSNIFNIKFCVPIAVLIITPYARATTKRQRIPCQALSFPCRSAENTLSKPERQQNGNKNPP